MVFQFIFAMFCYAQWTDMSVPNTNKYLYSAFGFLNQDTGYLALDTSIGSQPNHRFYLYKTINGGSNWTKETWWNDTNQIGRISFFGNKIGAIYAYPMSYKTSNKGQTWVTISSSDTAYPIKCFGSNCIGTGNYKMYNSNDLGQTWNIAGPLADSILQIFFLDKNNGWFVRQTNVSIYNNDQLWYTSNGGQTWQKKGTQRVSIYPLPLLGYPDLVFTDVNTGYWRKNANDTLFKTIDGGNTWQYWSKLPGNSSNAIIKFITPQVGFLATSNIYKTVDAGKTWNMQYTGGLGGALYSGFQVVDSNVQFAMQYPHYFIRTNNQGGSPFTQVSDVLIKDKHELNIYPNPATNQAKISFTGSTNMKTIISAYDINGKRILNKKYETDGDGKLETIIDLHSFSTGAYFIRVEQNGTVTNQKLIVY